MEKVSGLELAKLEKSQFLKPIRLFYTQNGLKKAWDLGYDAPSGDF